MPFVFQVCRARSTNNLHSQILASLFVFSALLPRHFELGPFVPKSRFCLSLGDVSLPAVSDPRPLLPGLSRNLSDTIVCTFFPTLSGVFGGGGAQLLPCIFCASRHLLMRELPELTAMLLLGFWLAWYFMKSQHIVFSFPWYFFCSVLADLGPPVWKLKDL